MNLEEENKEKRKNVSLTVAEWLIFFFFPIDRQKGPKFFNEIEEERLVEYGFDKNFKQASEARTLGCAFYVLIASIIFLIVIW